MSSDSGDEVSVDMKRTDSWNNTLLLKMTEAVQQQMDSAVYYQPYDEVHIDWDVVSESVGLDMEKCQTRWTSMLKCVRTFRTMPEIIMDMQTQYSKVAIRKANVNLKRTINKKPVSEAKKPKEKKNPDHPKKPAANGYSLFCQEMMPNVKDFIGINKFIKISEMWKEVSASTKAKYNEDSVKQKQHYLKEVKEYAENHPEDEKIQAILADLTKNSRKRPKSPHKKDDTPRKSVNGESVVDSEDEDSSYVLSPKKKLKFSPKSPKKVSKKTRTAESIYIDMKIESYREEHPEREEEYLVEKLKRKFSKLSDSKKEKYEEMANEDV